MGYKPVIGLEVHVELKTKSKMFCGCSVDYFGKDPNTHVCPVCLGLPGALPVPNKKAIEWCVMIGLALNCKIPLFSKFDRKNYFYPDLPKGYQISQYDQPFAVGGYVHLEGETDKHLRGEGKKIIRIRRVHMEEDTGKLIHSIVKGEKVTLIDFNRSGVPLVEIVTEPDFESATEVVEYLKKLQQIVRYLDVSDADMERGQMRLEPNISLSEMSLRGSRVRRGDEAISKVEGLLRFARNDSERLPTYKVEVKNINSFRFVEKAINYEIERQKKILESGKTPIQETRGWDSKKQITVSQRVKEETMDYRYFPEPDIPPIRWVELQISNFKFQMTELPDQKFQRFTKIYGLSDYDSEILTKDRGIAEYFEEAVKVNRELRIKNQESINTKVIANWIINKKVDLEKTMPAQLVRSIITSTQKTTVDQKYLEKTVKQVILDNPRAISDYKKGKANVIMFLVGMVLRKILKSIDPNIVKREIKKQLL